MKLNEINVNKTETENDLIGKSNILFTGTKDIRKVTKTHHN